MIPDLPSRAFFRDFAREFGALITVLHVAPAQAPEDWQTRRTDQARENIQCLMERLGVSGAVDIAGGEPSKNVAAAAVQANAGVLVIGRSADSSGLGDCTKMLARSSANRLARWYRSEASSSRTILCLRP